MKREYTMTMTEAFAYYEIKIKNCRSHWSGAEGKIVVVSLWPMQFNAGVYRDEPQPGDNTRDRAKAIKDLKHARDNCDGYFRVVMATEIDGKVSWDPSPNLIMRLVSLDETTGAFIAKVVHSQELPLAA
jgi:hypothetical protein